MVVGGEGCCPTMDLLRSEPMQLVQLIIPMESAHRTISYLGDLGLFQFKDVSIKQTHLIHIWICNVPISLHIWLFVWVIRFSVCFVAEWWAGYAFDFTYFMHYTVTLILIIPFFLDITTFFIAERLSSIRDFSYWYVKSSHF